MKKFIYLTLASLVLGSQMTAGALANENMTKEQKQRHVEVMKQAANELRSTNPSLASELDSMASMKEQKMNNM